MIVGERPIAFRKAIPQSGCRARLLNDARSAFPLLGEEIGEERFDDSGKIAGNAFDLLNEVLAQREVDRTLTCRTGGAALHSDAFWIVDAHYMRIAQSRQRQAQQRPLNRNRPNGRFMELPSVHLGIMSESTFTVTRGIAQCSGAAFEGQPGSIGITPWRAAGVSSGAHSPANLPQWRVIQ